MSVGYSDYTRVSNSGGFLLFSTSGNIANGTVLFQGYVGYWPYLNLFTDCNSSGDFCQIEIAYYSDATFSNPSGFRLAIRMGASFAATQYGNISPWVRISVNTISGSPFPFIFLSGYGTTGPSDQVSMSSLDVPIAGGVQSVPGAGTQIIEIGHIQPGDAIFQVQTASTSWYVFIEYFDYGSNAWIRLYQTGPKSAAGDENLEWPQLDAPMRITFGNQQATTAQFVYGWTSK